MIKGILKIKSSTGKMPMFQIVASVMLLKLSLKNFVIVEPTVNWCFQKNLL